ncbi:MAG: hypothetical protein KF752_10695 [Pirellulaceae bacterium]|nr:hypothetical protein [Pirellulaceae bacterium]
MINDTIRIRLSLGLIVVAIVHAILLGVVFTALHNKPSQPQPEHSWRLPSNRPISPTVGTIEKLPEPQSVNLQAQGEIKQQIRSFPPYCLPHRLYPAPVVVQPPIAQQPSILTPTLAPPLPPLPTQEPLVVTPVSNPAPPPPKKSYQIALFVNTDATSQRLQAWFTQNKELAALTETCEFQVYTATNALYKTRYADIVPAEQFPVVLFQDATGGHIHAAGRSMIPSTPEELYADLRHGFTLYKQAKEAQKTGAVKTKGYSWDNAITPTLYLSAEDCPDGYCPTPPSEDRRPLDRVRDLFEGTQDTRNALLWLSAGEIATVALIAIAAVLLVFILIKRGIS